MPSSKPTDELLSALPDVGLRVQLMQNKPGHPDASCYVCLAEAEFGPEASLWDGWGPDWPTALIMALRRAGITVTDEE